MRDCLITQLVLARFILIASKIKKNKVVVLAQTLSLSGPDFLTEKNGQKGVGQNVGDPA